jgi:chorismate-pyruvate lyase
VGTAGTSDLTLDALGVVPRILLATDGTLTHIIEAYAEEAVHLVKLCHDLVVDPAVRGHLELDEGERALRRIILLKGSRTSTTFVYADSVVMLDRLPPLVATGLLDTDRPIGKLLHSCRAETYREILWVGEERDPRAAVHFGLDGGTQLVSRIYQIAYRNRPVAQITEKFPVTAFPDSIP